MLKPSVEEVLEEYGGNAFGYASKAWATDPRFSDDIQQEAIVALVEAYHSFDWSRASHPGEFGLWLKKRVKDNLLDFRGSMSYSTSGSGRTLSRGIQLHETGALEDKGHPVEWSDESSEWLDAIMSTMDQLTARQRRVIGLYYLDGILSDTNVADVLGVRQHTVTELRKIAEARIRELLKAEYDD